MRHDGFDGRAAARNRAARLLARAKLGHTPRFVVGEEEPAGLLWPIGLLDIWIDLFRVACSLR